MKERERVDFDDYAENYREIHTENVQALGGADSDYFSEYKIVEVAPLLENARILDFGCGDGNAARFIQKHIRGYAYSGIDVSAQSVRKAAERNVQGCDFSHYDGTRIPFPDETFDVVFAACVFHHIDEANHVPLLGEIRRVLKTGGTAIVFEHNPLNPLTVKTVRDCPFDVGVKLIPGGGIKERIAARGLRQERRPRELHHFHAARGIFQKAALP